jgi:hypothetical protein
MRTHENGGASQREALPELALQASGGNGNSRDLTGDAIYEFLITDGHRIPTTLRNNPGNIKNALQRMSVLIKSTRTNDKGKDVFDVVSVAYDGHLCPEVKSPKRIFAFARDSKGDPMTLGDVVALVDRLKSIDWYSVKKTSPPAASAAPPLISRKRRYSTFGRLVFEGYHGTVTDVSEEFSEDDPDRVLAEGSIKAGKISKKLNLPCVFDKNGSTVSGDSMKTLASDEKAIYNADPVKLRTLIRVVGCILNYDDDES